jgi:hypothetical protein
MTPQPGGSSHLAKASHRLDWPVWGLTSEVAALDARYAVTRQHRSSVRPDYRIRYLSNGTVGKTSSYHGHSLVAPVHTG